MKEITLKFLTIGDASVGKTCIMLRFAEDNFPINMMPTIGVEYKTKQIEANGRPIKLQVWDTAGQERYHKTISATFYRRANVIILVFDLNDRLSFEHIRNWMHQIQQKAEQNTAVALVGNKADLERKVEMNEVQELAGMYQIPFFIVSAKTGENVPELFERMTQVCFEKNPQLLQETGEANNEARGIVLPPKPNKKKSEGSTCC